MVNTDLIDEMVEPTQQDHNSDQEQPQASDGSSESDDKHLKTSPPETDVVVQVPSLTNGQSEVKTADGPASTSFYCSLPLSRDVQTIIDTFAKTGVAAASGGGDGERKKTRKLPCLYCERTFVADSLRQKHVERCHSMKQARRSSSRFQQAAAGTTNSGGGGSGGTTSALQCHFCDGFQPAGGDDELSDLFRHLVGEHADRYFACVACRERFVLKTHLEEHREETHGIKREHLPDVPDTIDQLHSNRGKTSLRSSKPAEDALALAKEDLKELRSRKTPIKGSKLGTKRSARLQNKETPKISPTLSSTTTPTTTSTISSTATTNSKKKSKGKEQPPPDPAERESLKVGIHENPYPTFDAFYRVKKITDHSIDNLRITSLTFNDVFDQAFYTRIKCNIAENLQNHIDGKLFKNEESESRISNFEKTEKTEVNAAERHYGCEISLHAATPVASFLAPQQLGDDPEAHIEYASKASKKKTKPDEVHYKYFTRRKYQASIQEIKENRDLSKLDMWTQYVVKNRQQAVANTAKSEKERQEYKRGEEYRAKLQHDELNRILDRRGPFEDLKLEANAQAALEGNRRREARVEAACVLEDVLQRVFEHGSCREVCAAVATTAMASTTTELMTDAEMPAYLNLRRASAAAGVDCVDRSDRITLICSSEETENFEVAPARDKHALVELSGEWTRARMFVCAACGMRLANMRALVDHKNGAHPNVWCQHYEFVGKQAAYYRHLSIPGLGKMDVVEAAPAVKAWQRSAARTCTKCTKMCNTLGELHRHILECGEDWSWMLMRKKCKYRPYGAKTRRKRRGLIKRHETSKKENKEKKTYKKRTDRPREKPSDAETIQRMLANLPAKRATRTEMSLKDGFPKASSRKKEVPHSTKGKKGQKAHVDSLQDSAATAGGTLLKRKVMVASKCNPVGNVRKSVRNVNKVISSALIDSNIMVRRKLKALQVNRATRASRAAAAASELPEAPLELTEEQRAEEVKKKISLFKKVQKFRRSVIKRRTTKASSSSAESLAKPIDGASCAPPVNVNNTWRKTRSASNLTESSGSSAEKPDKLKSPSRKKLRSNFGTRLLRTLSMRRRSKKEEETASTSSASTTSGAPEEKRQRFAGIKKVVKKLKAASSSNRHKMSSPLNVTDGVGDECTTTSVPTNEHFLEEGSRESAIRTISEVVDKRDNDNRPVAPSSDSLVTIESPSCKPNVDVECPVPIVTITPSAPEDDLTKVTLEIEAPPTGGQLVSPLPSLPSLSPSLGRKSKLCKRTKGLNDCIAMLTSKLQCQATDVRLSTSKPLMTEAPPMPLPSLPPPTPQQSDAAVVVVTPHDTTTEEQNVVIPEETVSENLESAKEPEAAPPTPPLSVESGTSLNTQTSITISDLSAPVIEQDKENIEMEQKTLLPAAMKQAYDVTLEKVVDLIKCFEDIHPKERNGHVDHKVDVLNGLKLPLPKKKQTTRKIGAQRKQPKQRTFIVQEQLNIARLEEDLILNDFERKLGTTRRNLQRRTKKTFVDLKIPEIRFKDRGLPKSVPSICSNNLSTILEEPRLLAESLMMETCPDKGHGHDGLQIPRAVHTVQQILEGGKEELPVDLSVAKKVDVRELSTDDVPVDLSTRKTFVASDLDMPITSTSMEKSVEVMHPDVSTTIVTSNVEETIENEPIVLEEKEIPQPQLSQPETSQLETSQPETSLPQSPQLVPKEPCASESEDELPLATLRKSIGPINQKASREGSSEPCSTQTNQESPKGNTLKSQVFNPPDPIVISDEESQSEQVAPQLQLPTIANNPFILQDVARRIELKLPQGLIATNLQLPSSVITFPSVAESVVCTPDLGITTNTPNTQTEHPKCKQSTEQIDFEDVIPVVSIPESKDPSESVVSSTNETPTRKKRGRKARTPKLAPIVTSDEVVADEHETGSALIPEPEPEDVQSVQSAPVDVSVADTTQEIHEAIEPEEPKAQSEVCTISTCLDNQLDVGTLEEDCTGKGITLKTMKTKTKKVGRPKSKKKKIVKAKKTLNVPQGLEKDVENIDMSPATKIPEEVKIPEQSLPEESLPKESLPEESLSEEEIKIAKELVSEENVKLSEEAVPEEEVKIPGESLPEEIIPDSLEQEKVVLESIEARSSKTRKSTGKLKQKKLVTPNNGECPIQEDKLTPQTEDTSQSINGESVLTPEKLLATEELQTPKKAKSKRGRKPKLKTLDVSSETSPGDTGDNTITEDTDVAIIATRSLRKRKSDEMLTPAPPPITNVSDVSPETALSPLVSPVEVVDPGPKKTIAIYDFDEEDECTGDNSKENMEQLKPKSSKRAKRNGHSPVKVPTVDEKDAAKVMDVVQDVPQLETVSSDGLAATPLKDMQNDAFIQTPDLNDSVLAAKIGRFKVRKGKSSKVKKPVEVQEHYCEICCRQFGRLDSLNKHRRTLTHIAKLSEIEALEAEAKKKQSETNSSIEQEQKEVTLVMPDELVKPDETDHSLMVDKVVEETVTTMATPKENFIPDNDLKELNALNDSILPSLRQSDVATSLMVTSPFSLTTRSDTMRLADIISDVLNKPVDTMDAYTEDKLAQQAQQEPKRYKSLGERKSFDSDSYTPTPTFNISPASTLINKTSDEFLKNQLSLLENIIEENKASFEYMHEDSVQSIGSDRCPSDMSLVSDIKEDSSRIISYNDDQTFVQPNLQYEEISEDSMHNREQERSRKTLNRDEELFLECCSLLKSRSEVGEGKRSRVALPEDVRKQSEDCDHSTKEFSKEELNGDDFLSDSCPNTPIGDAFDDLSSDTMKTDWSTSRMNDYGDISDTREEDSFKSFSFQLDSKSDIDESSNSVDFRKNINAKFVGLMAEALKGKPLRKRRKERERRKSDTTQTSIVEYAVQLTPKSSSNSGDNFTDVTNDSKKVMTKGAMKVFEGLKVSIPTHEIDMTQVLDCSPTSKRLELEETAKTLHRNKGPSFGNKLGLKVTKKRNAGRKCDDSDGDKLHDVYDFEETLDNTDLFASSKSLHFRNGSRLAKVDDDDEQSVNKRKIAEIEESEESNHQEDFDLFGAEVQSVNSFSTETESSASLKPPSAPATQENITKKKCQIMGRIFKNAFKAKMDGAKETVVDDGDVLENYIIGGPVEEIATPPPEKSPVTKERPKMSEKEMDLLFDKLLKSKDDQGSGKFGKSLEKLGGLQQEASGLQEMPKVGESLDSKESKNRKATPKSVKANRRRSRKHSESSDDEFNLTKSPKKRQARKSKPRDNGINMDEEIKQCMGVAGRKSQRKCTSGKQNVLIEYWSSDDSEFEAMLRLSMQESGGVDKATTNEHPPPEGTQINMVDTKFESPKTLENKMAASEEVTNEIPISTTIAPKIKTKRTTSAAKNGRDGKSPRGAKSKHPKTPRSAQDEATLAANRRKRAAVDTLYYWSSSSEDDTQNLIEVKSVRDEIDDEEDRPQHGWIVGDSPKKLVTLLAHAKGKKTNR